MDIYIGFDSAWTDNPKAPGAICAVAFEGSAAVLFHEPRLARFDEALAFIREVRSASGTTLVALDQSTVVPNSAGMRPVERVAASLVSWLGGGVQPSNRKRLGMFCDSSPIWRFLSELGAVQDPERSRLAADGLYLMEVFPALALASMGAGFFRRLGGPRYNPARKNTFRVADWVCVAATAAQEARMLGCEQLAEWCANAGRISRPRKADQDRLDSVLCVLIALRWRLRPREASVLLGDLAIGYIVSPATLIVREYLTKSAEKYSVAVDGSAPLSGTGSGVSRSASVDASVGHKKTATAGKREERVRAALPISARARNS